MKTCGVICEFNPFHNGHKYLLSEIRKQGFDTIICVMSGSFTQRGDVAIIDKFARTRCAIQNGADLVIELPTPFAVASAQRFAKGAVEILNATGIVDSLYFGSESGDIELLRKAACATENSDVKAILQQKMGQGEYYPLALESAVKEVFSKETSDILASPNNILAVEYIKELEKFGINAGTIKRKAVEHDSSEAKDNFASASLIREMIFSGRDVSKLAPCCDYSNPAKLEFGERAILLKLKTMSIEEISELADVSEGLENRIYSASRSSNSLEELLFQIKTKRYTLARLRRIIASALLGITKELQNSPLPYLRILGMNDIGKEALSQIAKKSPLPVVTSVASALKSLDTNAQKMLLCDINATDIRTIFENKITYSGKDFTEAIVK